jgi:hypothetical protein
MARICAECRMPVNECICDEDDEQGQPPQREPDDAA